MSSIFGKTKGFGKRSSGGTVAERKAARNKTVRLIVAKLKAAGKLIDRQAINQEVLMKSKRHHQKRGPARKK